MINYTCELTSSTCSNFQSAICLHCKRRLCVDHIIEHNQMNFRDDLEKLSDVVQAVAQQIKDQSEKSKLAYESRVPAFEEWKAQQMQQVDEVYERELQLLDVREKLLLSFHLRLLEQIERGVRQPLERLQMQQHANNGILNHLQQTIQRVQQDMVHLKWPVPMPSMVITRTDGPGIPDQVPISAAGESKVPDKHQPIEGRHTFPVVELTAVCPTEYLVGLFSQTLSIAAVQLAIDIYVKRSATELPAIVNAYLTACHKKPISEEKLHVLNEHVSTIHNYVAQSKSNVDVLIGLQTFFHNNLFEENEESSIMAFLLKFLLEQRCTDHKQILQWFSGDQAGEYEGFEKAKRLARTFVQTLSACNDAM